MSSGFFITRKEYPKDENTISAKLLIKSGMIFKKMIMVYIVIFLWALKVVNNVKRINKR
ncbi:MAG: hypothetical protein L6V81_00360 [Clostridium sp.]|nr:MAG: hypothetical protein L6V81_00360 [Clostridium sp.]